MIVYPASFLGGSLWSFSTQTLSWPSSTAGYTQLTGGIVSNLYTNSWTNTSAFLGFQFAMAASTTSQSTSFGIRISTNGQFKISAGAVDLTNDKPSIPSGGTQPLYYGNAGGPTGIAPVNSLQPGSLLADGDTQNVWYRSGSVGQKYYADIIVYSGIDGVPSGVSSYMFSLYKDPGFQWMVTRTKTTPNSTFAGPYNPTTDVSQPASTTSQVWRAGRDVNSGGTVFYYNWQYVGTGSVV